MVYYIKSKEFDFDIPDYIEKSSNTLKKITTQSFIDTKDSVNDKNIACLYLPKELISKKPFIIIHGICNRNIFHLSHYAREFAKSGIAALLPIPPFHNVKDSSDKNDGTRFLLDDMHEPITDFGQSVVEIRQHILVLQKLEISDGSFSLVSFSSEFYTGKSFSKVH